MKPFILPLSRRILLAITAASLILVGCAGETTRREGVNLILEGQVDQGLAKLQEAAQAAPKNADIQMEYLRQRDQVINRLLTQANSARVVGDFAAAETHFRHVLALDPNNAMALGGLKEIEADRRNSVLLNEAQQRLARGDIDGAKDIVRMILIERPNDPQANQMRHRFEEQSLAEKVAGPRLNVQGRRPVTLQFRDANLKMVLEAIAKATGINILMDREVRNDIKVTIFVKESPVEETLDLILLQNQLDKRVIGPNSVLVYAMTSAKQKEYQELKVRRFVLTNAEPKQVQGMLKSILKVKDLYVDDKTNAIIVRDTDHVIRLAEKLIASIDLPEPEVMLEVQLLDLDRKKTLQLGIDWPNMVTWTFPLAAGGNTLRGVRNIVSNGALMTFSPSLGATLKALEADGDTRVLATPRIRTRSKEKARVMIGNRTPIISSAAVPSTAIGSAPVYNTNIQYLDTGIKLEVEPNVYIDGEVSIKISLEVSDLGTKYENTTTGTLAYATTTNNLTTTLRLKDGETQVLAGLLRSMSNNNGNQKVPGAGDIPLLGRLFGIQSDTWENRELVLAITPRIVRNTQPSDADLVEMWSGTDANVRYDAFHKGPAKPALPSAAAGSSSPRQSAAPVLQAEESEASAEAAPTQAVVSGAPLRPQLAGPAQARVGETISVSVDLPGTASGVNAATFALKYDAEILQPIKISEGSISTRSGSKSMFHGEIDASAAQAVGILQMDGNSVAATSGSLGVVQFKVLAAGKAAIYPMAFSALGPEHKPLVVVKPQALQVNLVSK